MGHDFHWAFAIQNDENIKCMVWSKDNSYGEFCGYRQIVATGPGAAAGMIAAHEYIEGEYPGAMTHKAGYWFIPSDPKMSAINRVGEMKGVIGGTDAVTSCDTSQCLSNSRPSFDNCINGLEALESLAARMSMKGEVLVVASCPEEFHDDIEQICGNKNIGKAFGRAGDMVNSLDGGAEEWFAKWSAKVVVLVADKVKTNGSSSAKLICIEGGPQCAKEVAEMPRLKQAIRQEMRDDAFNIDVEWIEGPKFIDKYG